MGPQLAQETTPIKVGNALYLCSPTNKVIALDPDSGRQLWRFDPKVDVAGIANQTCRGVAYYEQSAASNSCRSRVFVATLDARMFAVDAKTGIPCPGFGNNGAVNLLDGLGKHPKAAYAVSSPPTVIGNTLIVGGWVKDGQAVSVPSGVIRAFDAVSGRLIWAWDMGRPDRIGAPGPNEEYTKGTPNNWTLVSADPALGLVYVPLGNPSPDYFGGQRRPFDEKFGSSLVALDVTNGRPRWVFQTVHHDLWDYDLAAPPALFDMRTASGKTIPALVQVTKRGQIFVLDRRTGRPIHRVEERAVSTAVVPGERASPTQPYSTDFPEVTRAALSEHDMWGITPIDQMICRLKFRRLTYRGQFTAPGLKDSLILPGPAGGMNWSGVTVDIRNNMLVVNSVSMPFLSRLVPRADAPSKMEGAEEYYWSPQRETPYVSHVEPFLNPLGVPCARPPWGLLSGIDLNTGKSVWQKPFGTMRANGPLGIESGLPFTIGTPNVGGAITTAGNVTFIAATTDRYFRALDTRSGVELWRYPLPAGGQATPSTYKSNRTGRQYVVISAGGHPGLGTRKGDYVMAFTVP